MSIELKIKAMSLGAEIRIIRAQERRITKNLRKRRKRRHLLSSVAAAEERRATIRAHHAGHGGLSEEARATCWARAFLAGKPYRRIENESELKDDPNLQMRLLALATRMALKYASPCVLAGKPGDNRHPNAIVMEKILNWLGRDVRIFTARVSGCDRAEVERHINRWCWKYLGQPLPITCTKDFNMIELWDDRCVQVVPNSGRTIAETINPQIIVCAACGDRLGKVAVAI